MVTDKTKLEMAEIRDSRPSPKNKEKYLDMWSYFVMPFPLSSSINSFAII
jgi:hypothetical protein